MVSTVRDGVRSSSATSYLGPKFSHRPNLHVVLNTRVTRILPDPSSKHFRTVELAQTPDGEPPLVRLLEERFLIVMTRSEGANNGQEGDHPFRGVFWDTSDTDELWDWRLGGAC